MLSKIKAVTRYPELALFPLRDLNEFLHSKIYYHTFDGGVDVMAEDWDNLIILDSARFDYFKDICSISGELRSITSKGSNSEEFVLNTFNGEKYHDTILVTGNLHYEKLDNRVFYYVESVYEGANTIEDLKKTVKELINKTIKFQNEYPNKRIITHFLKPHVPYLSDRAKNLRENIANDTEVVFRPDNPNKYNEKKESNSAQWFEFTTDLHHARRLGLVGDAQLRDLYKIELETILKNVETLVDEIDGKTVITADHGEFLGERLPPLFLKHWTHPGNVYADEVREVPWLVLPSSERRNIRADPPLETDEVSEKILQEHLESLGYL